MIGLEYQEYLESVSGEGQLWVFTEGFLMQFLSKITLSHTLFNVREKLLIDTASK